MDGIGSAEGCWGSIGVLGRMVRSDMGVRMGGWGNVGGRGAQGGCALSTRPCPFILQFP